MPDKNQLLQEIYETSFAVVDLTLYLDTHPEDVTALVKFDELKQRRKAAMDTFAQEYYPLTVDCVNSGKKDWAWGNAPAPWLGGMTNVEL